MQDRQTRRMVQITGEVGQRTQRKEEECRSWTIVILMS